jgi:hypothetical protein
MITNNKKGFRVNIPVEVLIGLIGLVVGLIEFPRHESHWQALPPG